MNGLAQPGLEVTLHNGPEIVAQPDENKYPTGSSQLNEISSRQPAQSIHPASKPRRSKAFLALAVIIILCLAAALGAGLGAGLTTKRKSSILRYAHSQWSIVTSREASLY